MPAVFHPAVERWFSATFPAPTDAQAAAWPAIQAGRHTLVAAPTGSGKTLTAFLAALDALVRRGLSPEGLPAETTVVYVSPLKALSNDIRANLEAPLQGIRRELAALGLPDVDIRTAVRTGDTPAKERQQALRRPPHVLVTTPESLYVLLGSVSGRKMLSTVRTVIVDEIHALAADKRGSHLALTLERLQALVDDAAEAAGRPAAPLVRIGLSATQKPIAEVARFLVGAGATANGVADCEIVDIGYSKRRDLALELPQTPLSAVMSNEQWAQVYARVAALAREHRTTLVFVNTRRMAERAARHLGEILGREVVAAHHGSLSKETRLDAEQRLKRGELTLLVATASLELGLDIGDVDLVCQFGSPRSIATFLQRAGRSGHAVGGTPKARLFPQSRDELVECAALLDCVRRGELDALRVLPAPLDVLAQQIVAETACREWDEDALFALVRRAWPYAALTKERFLDVVRMLSEGYTTRHGQRGSYVHRDAVHHRLRERKGSRMTALTSGGTIPETGDYTVMLEPQADKIGSVNEDFAVESLAGDVFQLGNTSYRILKIEPGRVRVEDAHGAAPNIPFWLGEAPGRSDELSFGVARLREEAGAQLAAHGPAATLGWFMRERGLDEETARQLVDYLGATLVALGSLPTQTQLVIERFFDASGGMQLVIHSPLGSRINRAWGLALRKRFCRNFNFELQAAATEDAIVLSLSTSHSFPLMDVVRYLHSASALDVLVQALLDAPLFNVRWRWNATTALALPRFSGGRKVAPQLQRMKSEDLLAAVFPDQVACAENLSGPREVPAHPLVAQTLQDCLCDAMDSAGWLALLRGIESGDITVTARDLAAPSPLAVEALQAAPYAFLDDAPLEERRAQAVQNRRYVDAETADDLGRLDPQAIASVREEAWPRVRSADEMHEALTGLGVVTDGEVAASDWKPWLAALSRAGRATRLAIAGGRGLWVAAERLRLLQRLHPEAPMTPVITAPDEAADTGAGIGTGTGTDFAANTTGAAPAASREDALRGLLRARMGGLGPTTVADLAAPLGVPPAEAEVALLALQTEGTLMQGRFSPGAPADEWCERHLLARIHRYTLGRLRREIEPVEPRDFARFLFEWQHVAGPHRVHGPEALAGVLSQLEGYEAPAALWESDILPARVDGYAPAWLDELCTAGRTLWTRLRPVAQEGGAPGRARSGGGSQSLRATPILLLPRRNAALWMRLAPAPVDDSLLGSRTQRVAAFLAQNGASFFDEMQGGVRLLPSELEDALTELVVRGRAHCDSYAGLRALLVPAAKRAGSASARRGRRAPLFGIADAGRWTLIRTPPPEPTEGGAQVAPAPAHDDGWRAPAATASGSAGTAPAALSAACSASSAFPANAAPSLRSAPIASTGPASRAQLDAVEQVARILLRRYGVICWRLLEREAAWLPAWRDLVRACRRLEARGELRGGRFIAGVSGEQFALPEAVAQMRQVRKQPHDGALLVMSAADPANLLGTLMPGAKVPRVAGSRIVWQDGVPLATVVAGELALLAVVDDATRAQMEVVTSWSPAWSARVSEAVAD